MTNVIVIGAGYAGLSAATCLSKRGYNVEILEKNSQCGGRSRMFEHDGFRFDMGPSWYWMPDVFEKYFELFDKRVDEYYRLSRLDPGYRVFFQDHQVVDVPGKEKELFDLFESIEQGSGSKLNLFLEDAKEKYNLGINDFVYKPSTSLSEFTTGKVISGAFKMNLFTPFSKQVRKYFRDPKLIQIMEFPVLFLGAKPDNIPSLYSLMNYADLKLGTWYPEGGMFEIVQAMESLAVENGVKISLGENVKEIKVESGVARKVITDKREIEADVVVGGADYHHVEQCLLNAKDRTYSEKYWNKRVMAPSCIIFYCGINKKLKKLRHHNLFFDEAFNEHAEEIYDNPKWPTNPLFYVAAPSKTDPSVAPEGMENLFILIPVAPGLKDDTEKLRDEYFNVIMSRLEKNIGEEVKPHVLFKKSYAYSNFIEDYNAFKGNAYGLANTLRQTAILKPSIKSKRVKNLYFTGQLTVPGPGVPPAIISGQVVASEIDKNYSV